jgi:hypothetical protein
VAVSLLILQTSGEKPVYIYSLVQSMRLTLVLMGVLNQCKPAGNQETEQEITPYGKGAEYLSMIT